MPALHRYLGTPLTTWVLNVMYGSHFSDIHCGMRGITVQALRRMALQSQSWEYASEMVLKSVHMGLRTSEVPVRFLKDREGRVSHHRRAGWFSPFHAAWINLRAMFVYGVEFFALKPGLSMLLVGLVICLPLCFGPISLDIYGIVGREGGVTAQWAEEAIVIPPLFPDRVTPHTEAVCAVLWHLLVSHPSLSLASARWESLTGSGR